MDTILVVEDEKLLRDMIGEGLRRHGYEVLMAGERQEAARVCAKHNKQIHLMICDVKMPGPPLSELIRVAVNMHPSMKVLLMTGYAEEDLFPNGNAEGFHCIQKPFTPTELAGRLAAILGGGHA